jgi:choline-glycine betaine transporter
MTTVADGRDPVDKKHYDKVWRFELPKRTPESDPNSVSRLNLNPVVFICSAVLLWAFVISCCIWPDDMHYQLRGTQAWVTDVWTWLYILSQNIWIAVLIYVLWFYGDVKLGKDDEKPEWGDLTWFSMLFAAGVATGLWYYSVAEPMWHYKGWGGARWTVGDAITGNENEDAIFAMVVTYFHWGLHGWIPYTLIGAVLGLLTYKRGFPMSIRYCFWPLIGDKVYGWIGDLIDILSILTTIFGVCTSLGLGAMQINSGLNRLSLGFFQGTRTGVPDDFAYQDPTCDSHNRFCSKCGATDVDISDGTSIPNGVGGMCYPYDLDDPLQLESTGIQISWNVQIFIIAAITLIATVSVVSGLKRGIVNLSRFTFGLGNLLLVSCLFMGDTWHILNVITQAVGYYIWYLPKISFVTDAYELLGGVNNGMGGMDGAGGQAWMDTWTIFYWGWWISWGPFVGTFLAKISRGRTLRSFILATLILPTLYCFVWFGVWGAEGIRMQRLADTHNVCKAAYSADSTPCTAGTDEPCKVITGGLPVNDEGYEKYKETSHANPVFTCGNEAALGGAGPKCYAYSAQYSDEYKNDQPERLHGKPPSKKRVLEYEPRGWVMGYEAECELQDQASMPSFRCKRTKVTRKRPVGSQCISVNEYVAAPCLPSYRDQHASWRLEYGSSDEERYIYRKEWTDFLRMKREELFMETKSDPTHYSVEMNEAGELVQPEGRKMDACTAPAKNKVDIHSSIWEDDWHWDLKKERTKKEAQVGDGANVITDGDVAGSNRLYNLFNLTAGASLPDCFIPSPPGTTCLYNQATEDVLFDQVESYGGHGLGQMMTITVLICVTFYFVCSSDSGSLVVDMLSANGDMEPPVAQRIFWSLTEGATAMALLASARNMPDDEAALRALQSASIVMGLPYTFVLFWVSQSLLILCAEEKEELQVGRKTFSNSIFTLNQWAVASYAPNPKLLVNTVFPPMMMGRIVNECKDWPTGKGAIWLGFFIFVWILLACFIILAFAVESSYIMPALAFYTLFSLMLALTRRSVRMHTGIKVGGMITDFLCAFFMPMFTLTQLERQVEIDSQLKVAPNVHESGDEQQARD